MGGVKPVMPALVKNSGGEQYPAERSANVDGGLAHPHGTAA